MSNSLEQDQARHVRLRHFNLHLTKLYLKFHRGQYFTTVKPVLNGHSKIDKTKIFMTNGSLMKVESIAECSPWSILQYF